MSDDLPPGVTQADIDREMGIEQCELCGKYGYTFLGRMGPKEWWACEECFDRFEKLG